MTRQPFFDTRKQIQKLRPELDKAWKSVLLGGRHILGPEVDAFEKEFARFCGAAHGIGVGSGTEALHIALAACGIGQGDEVITVSHSAVATATAIVLCGATPVFADVDPQTLVMDVRRVEDLLTRRTKAIVPVHLYGRPVDMRPLKTLARRRGLVLIEDACQAHGAVYGGKRVGSWGDMACFSFYPTKNLGAVGDGGMIVTSSAALARAARSLRQYGWEQRYISSSFGWNSRLDELQAAVLRRKLRYLPKWTEQRRRLAEVYRRELSGCRGVRMLEKNSGHVYHLFVAMCHDRGGLQSHLTRKGIQTLIHYPLAIHQQGPFKKYKHDGLPVTNRIVKEILSLPLYPEMTEKQVKAVCRSVRSFYGD